VERREFPPWQEQGRYPRKPDRRHGPGCAGRCGQPYEIEEAARIDGAGEWGVLRRVVVPLIRPGMTSVVLVVFLISWCDFLNPLVLLNNPGQYTVTVALYTYIGEAGQTLWGQLLAFGLLACIPPLIVIILAERHIVRGLVAGAVK
jgi:ABC-type glycerol-3-phosphate transport system permease component